MADVLQGICSLRRLSCPVCKPDLQPYCWACPIFLEVFVHMLWLVAPAAVKDVVSCYQMSRSVSWFQHSVYLPKVLADNDLDFLQPHAGLHMLSLDAYDFGLTGHDFGVTWADTAIMCCQSACKCGRAQSLQVGQRISSWHSEALHACRV